MRNPAIEGASVNWLETEIRVAEGKIFETGTTIAWLKSRIDHWEQWKSDLQEELARHGQIEG